MSSSFRIVSIGTLSLHPLWEEAAPTRTGHATTTLIESGDAKIIVDPGLPPAALQARLAERSPCSADDITHVFLTSFTPEHDRGLMLFPRAEWIVAERELEAAGALLDQHEERADEAGDLDTLRTVEARREVLRRVRPADDTIAPGVDLFPAPGVTPGTCGLLLPQPTRTIVIAGDAIATGEHLSEAKVLPVCSDVELAQESFREIIEIADVIVPGRDNVQLHPLRGTSASRAGFGG